MDLGMDLGMAMGVGLGMGLGMGMGLGVGMKEMVEHWRKNKIQIDHWSRLFWL
jgi:hypothetical protein